MLLVECRKYNEILNFYKKYYLKKFTCPVGSPKMCSGEGSSKRNRLVSWLIWSVSINLRAYFVFGSTKVTFFFFFWSKKTFARIAVTVTRPNPTKTGMIWNWNWPVCTQINDIISKETMKFKCFINWDPRRRRKLKDFCYLPC